MRIDCKIHLNKKKNSLIEERDSHYNIDSAHEKADSVCTTINIFRSVKGVCLSKQLNVKLSNGNVD